MTGAETVLGWGKKDGCRPCRYTAAVEQLFLQAWRRRVRWRMGRKLDASEGLPDLWMGWTMECFQDAGNSQVVRQELIMKRTTWPMAPKQSLRIRMLTPSEPVAKEFFIEEQNRLKRLKGDRSQRKGTGTHPGQPAGERKGLPLPRTSAATRGPTPTKYSFSSVGVASGTTRVELLPYHLPQIAEGGGRTLLPHPPGDIVPDVPSDDRFHLLSRSRKAWVRPSRARSPRRRAMRRRVVSEAGGAEGFRILRRFRGTWESRMGRNSWRKQSTGQPHMRTRRPGSSRCATAKR